MVSPLFGRRYTAWLVFLSMVSTVFVKRLFLLLAVAEQQKTAVGWPFLLLVCCCMGGALILYVAVFLVAPGACLFVFLGKLRVYGKKLITLRYVVLVVCLCSVFPW